MEHRMRLLVIDDDRMMCQLLTEYLAPNGYDVVVAYTGEEGVTRAAAGDIDAVILDVMLPGINGFKVLQKIRARSAVPVLMLTARGHEHERIAGLDGGADDYVSKAFSHRELLARLNAVVRRAKVTATGNVLEGAGVSLDSSKRVVRKGDTRLDLTPAEFDILHALMRANGRVLTREQLLHASERGLDVSDRSVDVHISSLRRKLGDEAKPAVCIETVRSLGYRFHDAERD